MRGQELVGKVALMTGGASGIGEATARKFGVEGAVVMIAAHRETKGHAIAASLDGYADFTQNDNRQEAQIARASEATAKASAGSTA